MKSILKRAKKRLTGNDKAAINRMARLSSIMPASVAPGLAIFHIGRCGSTVLERLLQQHSHFTTFGEIFNPHRPWFVDGHYTTSAASIVRHTRARALPKRAQIEIKFLKSQDLHYLGMSLKDVVDIVKQSGFRNAVVLNRKNRLKRSVSRLLAHARGGTWHYKAGHDVPDSKITIDLNDVLKTQSSVSLLEELRSVDAEYDELLGLLEGWNVLELTYEDDIEEDPKIAYRKICQWLGIPEETVEVELRRSKTRPMSEVVENFDDVGRLLRGTEYEWMLRS